MWAKYQLNKVGLIGKAPVYGIIVNFKLLGVSKMTTGMMKDRDYQAKMNYILLINDKVEPYIE